VCPLKLSFPAPSGTEIHGATFHNGSLHLSDTVSRPNEVYLRWEKRLTSANEGGSAINETEDDAVLLPVYLNSDRKDALFSSVVRISGEKDDFVTRSVALTA
jgi:hypothetical protein